MNYPAWQPNFYGVHGLAIKEAQPWVNQIISGEFLTLRLNNYFRLKFHLI